MEILEPTGLTQSPARKYPWRAWLQVDNRPRVLDRLEDFPDSTLVSFRVYLTQQATAKGIKVTTRIVKDPVTGEGRYIVYQAYHMNAKAPLLPDFTPSEPKRGRKKLPRCRTCKKKLTDYAVPYGECRNDGDPNTKVCKAK